MVNKFKIIIRTNKSHAADFPYSFLVLLPEGKDGQWASSNRTYGTADSCKTAAEIFCKKWLKLKADEEEYILELDTCDDCTTMLELSR